jgi:hypothetical protein
MLANRKREPEGAPFPVRSPDLSMVRFHGKPAKASQFRGMPMFAATVCLSDFSKTFMRRAVSIAIVTDRDSRSGRVTNPHPDRPG